MLQLIEENHGFVTCDWPEWVVLARPFQFAIVLPIFAAIIRYYAGRSELVTPVSILVMVVLVGVVRLFMLRRFQHRKYDDGQAVDNGCSRVVREQDTFIKCIGMREELSRLRGVEPNFFEPHIVKYLPYPHVWNDWVALTTTAIVLFTIQGNGLILDIILPSCVLVGLMMIVHVFSSKIRIVPGRLDILRVPLFKPGEFRLAKTVSLRDKNIVCNFATRLLTMRPRQVSEKQNTCNSESLPAESVDFDLRRVAMPHALVRFVSQGARCPVDAPNDEYSSSFTGGI